LAQTTDAAFQALEFVGHVSLQQPTAIFLFQPLGLLQ
jgi:hypothetical protein